MSIEDAKYLNPGDKVIFKCHGGGLNYRKGYVFTYLRHYSEANSPNVIR